MAEQAPDSSARPAVAGVVNNAVENSRVTGPVAREQYPYQVVGFMKQHQQLPALQPQFPTNVPIEGQQAQPEILRLEEYFKSFGDQGASGPQHPPQPLNPAILFQHPVSLANSPQYQQGMDSRNANCGRMYSAQNIPWCGAPMDVNLHSPSSPLPSRIRLDAIYLAEVELEKLLCDLRSLSGENQNSKSVAFEILKNVAAHEYLKGFTIAEKLVAFRDIRQHHQSGVPKRGGPTEYFSG
ncbi:uncharacterized protein LOC129602278 [Paramacrobiotus metropolitanus]|uniref:uncharacterized protein LOC129602278 n=1 Tax=Paramacrobiotus metropolitanus TaxID=2943436 RepID=UPI0024457D44|nr:uncharacterized protein LOC129602278 [Paramacrobiotus metropolitanus]